VVVVLCEMGNNDWCFCVVSGAGKTYTMLGRDDHPGIMARALTELFTQMRRTNDDHVYKVTMSYLEVQPAQHHHHHFITARCYVSAVLAMGLCPSVCLSVSVSVTSRCSTKRAKRRITQTTPHDSPGTLVFRCQRSQRNSTGVTPSEGAECRWGGSKSATCD